MKWHDPAATFAEGSRAAATGASVAVIERLWRAGGTFQEWSEHFALDRWIDAMHAEGLDPDWYVTRHRTCDEVLPWDHITAGLHNDFLWQDWQAALAEHGLPDCRWTPCYDCGVCTDYALEHVVASPVPPAGGSQGTGQDLVAAAPVPATRPFVSWAPVRTERMRCAATPGSRSGSVHEAGQDPLDLASRRRPGDRAGVPRHPATARVHGGLLAPAQGQLRAGALDRSRE